MSDEIKSPEAEAIAATAARDTHAAWIAAQAQAKNNADAAMAAGQTEVNALRAEAEAAG